MFVGSLISLINQYHKTYNALSAIFNTKVTDQNVLIFYISNFTLKSESKIYHWVTVNQKIRKQFSNQKFMYAHSKMHIDRSVSYSWQSEGNWIEHIEFLTQPALWFHCGSWLKSGPPWWTAGAWFCILLIIVFSNGAASTFISGWIFIKASSTS